MYGSVRKVGKIEGISNVLPVCTVLLGELVRGFDCFRGVLVGLIVDVLMVHVEGITALVIFLPFLIRCLISGGEDGAL